MGGGVVGVPVRLGDRFGGLWLQVSGFTERIILFLDYIQ
jgi:hypothetical protein